MTEESPWLCFVLLYGIYLSGVFPFPFLPSQSPFPLFLIFKQLPQARAKQVELDRSRMLGKEKKKQTAKTKPAIYINMSGPQLRERREMKCSAFPVSQCLQRKDNSDKDLFILWPPLCTSCYRKGTSGVTASLSLPERARTTDLEKVSEMMIRN